MKRKPIDFEVNDAGCQTPDEAVCRSSSAIQLPTTNYQLSTDRKRAAFTIVELLVVIAIISILAGAITMGVNGMFYKSRFGRAKAIHNMIQSGLETYYARNGEWPTPIRNKVDYTGGDSVRLTADEADACFREIVRVSSGENANPVMDPSGLVVAKNIDEYGCTDIHKTWGGKVKVGGGTETVLKHVFGKESGLHQCNGKCARGRDFTEATKKGSKDKISLSQMNFGYVGPNNGRFCRFRLYYYPKSDTVKVYLQEANEHHCIKHGNGYTDD